MIDIFTPHFQTMACDEFIRRIDESEYVPERSLPGVAHDLERALSGVVFAEELIYAHVAFGGNPLVTVPFLNGPSPDRGQSPKSHSAAMKETAEHYDIPYRFNNFWSLYILRPSQQEDRNIYGLTWLTAASTNQLFSVRRMLRLMPRLRLFSGHNQGGYYMYRQVTPAEK